MRPRRLLAAPRLLIATAVFGAVALIAVGAALLPGGPLSAILVGTPGASQVASASEPAAVVPTPGPSIGSLPSAAPATATPSVNPSSTPAATFPPLANGVVPILYLHRVVAPPAAWSTWTTQRQRSFLAYDVIPAAFEAQLDWLQANGYTTILPRDLARHWDHGAPLPRRPVIISLDDGSASWTRTVLPMLQAHHMVAEFYLTLAAIRNGEITWDRVRWLARAGNGIGAHDVHHVQLAEIGPGVPDASPMVMWSEISEARAVIGREVGTLPDSMAYVGGGFDTTLVSLVRRAGYTTARSILRGIDQEPQHRFSLRVVAIAPGDDVVDFATGTLVSGLPVFAAKMAGTRT